MKRHIARGFTAIEDKLIDAGLYRTAMVFLATLGVLALLLVCVLATIAAWPFFGLDWLPIAFLWAYPAFSWIPALPMVAACGLSCWGLADEAPKSRAVDTVLATFALVGGAALIQGASVILNTMASSDPTAGLPVPRFLPEIFGASVVGYLVALGWNAFAYGRLICGRPKKRQK